LQEGIILASKTPDPAGDWQALNLTQYIILGSILDMFG
jgi:hypothetical protein